MGAEGLQAIAGGRTASAAQIVLQLSDRGNLLHLSEPFCAMKKIILAFKVVEASK